MIGLIFDLDGTLVDSLADICEGLNGVRRHYGLEPWPHEEIRPHIGKSGLYLMEKAVPEVSPEKHEAALTHYRKLYLEDPPNLGAAYEGVKETLVALQGREDVRLGVATNKFSPVSEASLAQYLPEVKFKCIYGPDRVTAKKPDARHLLEVAEAIGVDPGDCWYVGDHQVDREAACNAGIRFLAATYGFGGVKAPESEHLVRFAEILDRVGLN